MGKKWTSGPTGPSRFVMRSSDPEGRRPILRLSEALLGRGSMTQNFTFAFRDERQLAEFSARRVDVTVRKYLYTIALLYAAGARGALVVVEGAKLQTGTGNSDRVKRGGVSYFTGHEAAHFGIGTFTLQGRAVSAVAQEQVLALALARGVAPGDIPTEFEANGYLVVQAMVLDADTYVAPAFINRTEGLQEVTRQHYMLGLLPIVVPGSRAELDRSLVQGGDRAIHLLAAHNRAVVRPMEVRLLQLQGGTAKEFLQDTADTANFLFGGQERNLLTAMIAMVRNTSPAGGEFHSAIDLMRRRLPELAHDLAELAEAARVERA
jgi:hypothetical protein